MANIQVQQPSNICKQTQPNPGHNYSFFFFDRKDTSTLESTWCSTSCDPHCQANFKSHKFATMSPRKLSSIGINNA